MILLSITFVSLVVLSWQLTLTLMIAESKPAERELMVNLVMTFLVESGA